MKIISIYPGHNATIGYFEDGDCKFIFHEEKFNNIKNFLGFPILALKHLASKININDVDFFVFGQKTQMMLATPTKAVNYFETQSVGRFRRIFNYLEYKTGLKLLFSGVRNILLEKMVTPKSWNEISVWLEDNYHVPRKKVLTYDHHLAHCLTPLYFYGLAGDSENLLLLSMDGAGDNAFSKVFVYEPKNNLLKKIAESSFDSSIGLLYSEMTKFLGMKVNEHEYKVMGLAAYVSNRKYYQHIYEKLKEIVWLNEETLEFESAFNTNVSRLFFKDHFSFERFDNLAAALQEFTEELVTKWIQATIKKTGINVVAVSGGVFMNVKMNQKIIALPEVKKVYFQPSSGDESLIIGAACKTYLDNSIDLKPIKTMYLGHSYNDNEVKEFLERIGYFDKYQINYFEDIEIEIAKLIADFKIVARFKGQGEWGARSVCNRGILGNASDLKTFYDVNNMIKMRDFWMPFAPTILEEWADRYIENWKTIGEKAYDSMKFMIVTCNATKLAQTHLLAAMHQKDKTIRPQILSKQNNENLYRLLKTFEELTGMGGILNTSFNLHGSPLVGTLEQATFTFENSGLQYLAIENWMIKK